jgi:hypothetical protein
MGIRTLSRGSARVVWRINWAGNLIQSTLMQLSFCQICTEGEDGLTVPCDICGREKAEHALIASDDGLLICDRCNREYKEQDEDPSDLEDLFEGAT